jgi:antitoxin component of MazEF toxin-antitoxin module
MTRKTLKVARIGNSRGVRLPAESLRRYRIGDTVLMEERSDGILLRPVSSAVAKLSWEDTAREMARAGEDWSAWEVVSGDGSNDAPWEAATKVAEPRPAYGGKRPAPRTRKRR